MSAHNYLRRLRIQRNWRQEDLAEQLGVNITTVQRWERGSQQPTLYYRVKLCELFEMSAQELGLLEDEPQPLSEPAPGDAIEPGIVPEETTLWTVPYPRNPHFTGRVDLLATLEQHFAPPSLVSPNGLRQVALTRAYVLKGLGGIGKTQMAIEYAYRAREQGRYVHTLWILSESEEDLLAGFAALHEQIPALRSQPRTEQRVLATRVIRWLEQCPEPWLLIVDNADNLSFLPAYLPVQGQGSILITTRASAVGALASSLEIEPLSLEEGIQLLLHRAQREIHTTPAEQEDACTIVQALGHFPLAIDQAGAYLEETGCRLQDYIQIYQANQYALLARRGTQASGYPDSVATTWDLSFRRIEQTNPAAAEFLQLCAVVAPDQFPEELLTQGAAFWPDALREAVADRFRLNQLLETGLSFSLVKRVGEARMLSLHRLVQVVQRARMTPLEQRQWAERLVLVVQAIFPDSERDVDVWPQCQRYLAQAQACDTLIQEHHLLLPEAADVLDRAGVYLCDRALYRLAEPLLLRALDIREQQAGPEPSSTATSLFHLAILFRKQGKYARAEKLNQQALRLREQQLGPEHSDVADVLNSQALLYTEQGKYREAEPLYRRALRIWEQQFGSNHLEVTSPLNNLAMLYSNQGKYRQAELLYQRALHIRERQLGSEHLNVAILLHNLGFLYWHKRRYEQAEPFYQRARHIYEQQLGPDHPNLATTLVCLACIYYDQGDSERAEPLLQRALRIYERQLGPDHVNVAFPLHWLALIRVRQGKYEEAERLDRRALRIWEEQLGPGHPYVAYALHGLALLSAQQGFDKRAQAFFQQALHIREQRLGVEHLDTSDILHDFARFWYAQGRLSEASSLYQRALAIREQYLGSDHAVTRETRACLQETVLMPGQIKEAGR